MYIYLLINLALIKLCITKKLKTVTRLLARADRVNVNVALENNYD